MTELNSLPFQYELEYQFKIITNFEIYMSS